MTARAIHGVCSLGLCAGLFLTLGAGCSAPPSKTPEDPASEDPSGLPPGGGPTDRPTMTQRECGELGGEVVGDIGDGRIHRPDYRCENGKPPLGTVISDPAGTMATEGAVCCPGS